MRFYVVDGVEALSKFGGIDDAWDRVVCVMTTGQEWQFRPYKWQEPKELFHHGLFSFLFFDTLLFLVRDFLFDIQSKESSFSGRMRHRIKKSEVGM